MIEGLREILLKNIDDLIDNDIAGYFKNSLDVVIETISCCECGDALAYTVDIDEFNDIHITVDPCKCVQEE